MKLSPRQQKIIFFLIGKGVLQSSTIHAEMIKSGEDISLVTIKRALSELAEKGIVAASGSGRSTAYRVGTLGRIFADIDARAYCAVEPDKRFGTKQYNFDLLAGIPANIFSETEIRILNDATAEYKRRTKNLPL